MKTGEIISLCALLFTISYAICSEIIKFFSRRKRKKQEEKKEGEKQEENDEKYVRKDSLDERLTLAQETMSKELGELRESQEKYNRMLIKAIMEGKEDAKDKELSQYLNQKKPEYSDKDTKIKNERHVLTERMKRTGRK